MTVIPVFISSTFRDFHRERDILMQRVRPELDDALRSLGCRVEMIDLRWGIADTQPGDDDEIRQGRVLDVCLQEIDRARPLFVGLLGQRFGWLPPEGRAIRAARAAALDIDVDGLSVTALEFEHGVFRDSAARGVFLIRDFDGRPPPGFADDDPARIDALRQRVRQFCGSGRGAAHVYTLAAHDGRDIDYAPFEEIATVALRAEVLARARQLAATQDDSVDIAEQLFFEDRSATVAARDDVIDDLVRQVAAGASVCLVGPSGVGKSAIWCRVVTGLRQRGPVITVPVGAAAGLTSEREVIGRLAGQLGEAVPAALDGESLASWWRGVTARHGEVVVAVDGLDQLDVGETRDQLRMLIGVGGRVLVSTTDARQAALLSQGGVGVVEVPLIAARDVPVVVGALLNQMRRTIPAQAVALLGARDRSPLWLVLAVGELSALDEEDFTGVDVDADPIAELSRLVVDTVAELPDDVPGMVERFTSRLGRRFGWDHTVNILSTLALSRSGLPPLDLAAAVGSDDLTVAGVRRGFAGMIAERGTDGRLGFTHGAVKDSVVARFLAPHRDYRMALHRQIALQLNAARNDSPVRRDDTLWHWLHVEDDPGAEAAMWRIQDLWMERGNGDGPRSARLIGRALREDIDLGPIVARLGREGVVYLAAAIQQRALRGAPRRAQQRLADQVLARCRQLLTDNHERARHDGRYGGALIDALRAAASVSDPEAAATLRRELLAECASRRDTVLEGLPECMVLCDVAVEVGGGEGAQMLGDALRIAESSVASDGAGFSHGTWSIGVHSWTALCAVLERTVTHGADGRLVAERVLRYCSDLAEAVPTDRGLRRNFAAALALAARHIPADADARQQQAVAILGELIDQDREDEITAQLWIDVVDGTRAGTDHPGWLLGEIRVVHGVTGQDAAYRLLSESTVVARRIAESDKKDMDAQMTLAYRLQALAEASEDASVLPLYAESVAVVAGVQATDPHHPRIPGALSGLCDSLARRSFVTADICRAALAVSRRIGATDPTWMSAHIYRLQSFAYVLETSGDVRAAARLLCEAAEVLFAHPDISRAVEYRREIGEQLRVIVKKLRWRDVALVGECTMAAKNLSR